MTQEPKHKTRAKKKVDDWIVMNIAGFPGHIQCLRCGALFDLQLPQSVDLVVGAGKAFEKSHRRCKAKPEGLHCAYCNKTGHQGPEACPQVKGVQSLESWILGPDTGTSSRTIAHVLAGVVGPLDWPDIPLDPDDFGRCYRLLKLIPGWRERMGEVSAKYKAWKPLVDHWDELESLYEEEYRSGKAPKLYARMRALYEHDRYERAAKP